MNVHGLHSGSGAQYSREVRVYNVSLDTHMENRWELEQLHPQGISPGTYQTYIYTYMCMYVHECVVVFVHNGHSKIVYS